MNFLEKITELNSNKHSNKVTGVKVFINKVTNKTNITIYDYNNKEFNYQYNEVLELFSNLVNHDNVSKKLEINFIKEYNYNKVIITNYDQHYNEISSNNSYCEYIVRNNHYINSNLLEAKLDAIKELEEKMINPYGG